MPSLRIVADAETRPAPYPADTRVKGWRFELDHERIEQSDTWVLAPPEMRPWLLMLWMTAWKQAPCGSLPSSEELISARIGMPLRIFQAHRDVLLRGWWQADDGRMYHDTISEQVLRMIGWKAKETTRKAEYRARLANQALTDKCPTGQTRDGRGVPADGRTPEPEPEPEPINTNTLGTTCLVDAASPRRLPACPTEELLKLYSKHLPMLGQVIAVSEGRKRALSARWREIVNDPDIRKSDDPRKAGLEWFDWFFGHCASSRFLTGRAKPDRSGRTFIAGFDFLFKPDKFVRIVEGEYHKDFS